MFNKLKNKVTSFTNKYENHPSVKFINENYMDIALGLACVLVVEDLDDIAEATEVSTAVDVMTASKDGVI